MFFIAPCINSNDTTESSESRAQENDENPVIKDEVKKVGKVGWNEAYYIVKLLIQSELSSTISQVEPSQNATAKAETEAPPVKRRGRPPKTATTAPVVAEKEGAVTTGGAGRGRKRAADSNSSADSVNSKMSKQQQQNDEGSKRQIDLQR